MNLNRSLPRIDTSRFAMVPRADIPRSTFVTTHSHKTTFNASYLIPIHVDEVLPGDVHQGEVTIFARLATPVFPIMDSIELETFFFFCPSRLLWSNWKKMMGERANPSDSISYTVPTVTVPWGSLAAGSISDYFGIPPGQLAADLPFNALPYRAYNLIYNEWFRDQNLQNSLTVPTGDGPDLITDYTLKKRNKKHDYFTSCLPWPLKGGSEVVLPYTGLANVKGLAIDNARTPTAGTPPASDQTGEAGTTGWAGHYVASTAATLYIRAATAVAGADPVIQADLSTAAGQTINSLRLAIQTQRLLERDARSGTRYTELLRAHFGVFPEDQRLQRPEYIGGGRTYVQTQAIPLTATDRKSSDNTVNNPAGTLGATAVASDQHSFSYHATEHGYIIGLANVRGEITYQQGVHRLWTRSTRYDFYWPVFAHLGEQAVLNKELYIANAPGNDQVFGYQERWAEYRHRPSRISGHFRSTVSPNIDEWHLAEQFTALPALNAAFIEDKTFELLQRVLAAAATANGQQVLFDSVFRIRCTRPMPMFSVPGFMDRF